LQLRKNLVALSLSILVIIFSSILPVAEAKNFTDFYFLGDSNSDIGNTMIFGGTPNWTVDLASHFHKSIPKPSTKGGNNYAYAAAKTGHNPFKFPAYLLDQVDMLLKAKNYKLDPDAIYVIWTGVNNIIYDITTHSIDNIAQTSSQDFATAFKKLSAAGAKTFVFLNIENGFFAPLGRKLYGYYFEQLIRIYNQKIMAQIDEVATENNITIIKVDMFGLFNNVADAVQVKERDSSVKKIYNLDHVWDATCTPSSKQPDCFRYFFCNDGMHLTAHGQQIVADYVAKILQTYPYDFEDS